MNRRRILTGLVAAPFVARLGLLMPVRPVLSMRSMLANSGALDFETAWPVHQDVYRRLHYAIGPDGFVRAFFADDLARRFEALGGHLCLRALGRKILTENGRAYGVEIETGLPSRRVRRTVLADLST